MPVTVSRIYDFPEKAQTAASELKKYSFAPEHINIVTPNGHDAGATESALTKGGISAARAKVYAEAVSGGKSVVTVLPTFGNAAKAAENSRYFRPGRDAHHGCAGYRRAWTEGSPRFRKPNQLGGALVIGSRVEGAFGRPHAAILEVRLAGATP